MAIGYRAILSAEYSQDTLDRIVEILRTWAIGKKGFTALPSNGDAVVNHLDATLVANEVSESVRGISGYRWTLTEEWASPKWYKNTETSRTGITQISLVFSQGQLWLWVDIEPPTLEYIDRTGRERTEQQPSGTPAFVSEILSEVEMHDGVESPVSEIEIIANEFHVQHLKRVLRDTSRRGAVYVTSPPVGTSDKDWLRRVKRVIGSIEGMGFGYMLNNETRDTFNGTIASGHGVTPGSIRTFLPGAELDEPKDAVRHRLLHASTIQESRDARLQRIIRNAQIEHLRNVDLPDALRDADYAFLRQKGLRTFEVLHTVDPVDTAVPVDARTAELITRLHDAEDLLSMALDEHESLRKSSTTARAASEALRIENEETYLDIVDLRLGSERDRREIEYLRRELARSSSTGSAAAYGFDDEETNDYPMTFDDLLDRLEELSGIKYFGNRSDTEDLDEYSDLGDAAVMKAWDALVTFHAYAMAREEDRFEQSLSHYINNTQHGLPMRISKVKWSEGETVRTNGKMMAQRTVSGLPTSIDPSGSKLLVAHIALATGRAGSPRLYFEDTTAAAGFVTVGYIGAHLDNTLTN